MKFTPPEIVALRPRDLNPDGSLLSVSEWAEKYRIVRDGPRPGPWRNEHTPYLVEPMDMCADPHVQKVILCFAPQTGKTQVAFNFTCWAADQQPDPVMYVMPDEKTARRMSKRRILPLLRTTPRIRELMSPNLHDQTTLGVSLVNGMDIMLVWSTSAAELASESVRYMIFDETDKYPEFTGKEGDPISLGEARTTTYGDDRTVLYMSTPTDESGIITRALNLEADEVRHYWAVCPSCEAPQIMRFRNMTWPAEIRDPRVILRHKPVRYQCAVCGVKWGDSHRDQAVRCGFWHADTPVHKPQAIGYVLPSWYSPFVSLSLPVAAWMAGRRDPTKKWTFITQHKAQAWKETLVERKEEHILALKNELAPGILPAATVAVTCAIDVQLRGFWYLVRSWDGRLNTHLVDYGWLETWPQVTALLDMTYSVAGTTARKGIWRAGIDTGGGAQEDKEWSRTQEVYDFLQKNQWRRDHLGGGLYGIKGMSRKSMRIVDPKAQDFTASGKRQGGGLYLYFLNTDVLKENFFKAVTGTGLEGADSLQVSLHSQTTSEYARQILAEELRRDRRGKAYWLQVRRDNHLLDCEMISQGLVHDQWKPFFNSIKDQLATRRFAPDRGSSKSSPARRPAGVSENPYLSGSNPYQ